MQATPPGGQATQPATVAPASRSPRWNFIALSGGEIAARSIAFVGTAVLARRLGVEGFGIMGFALAMAGYFTVFVGPALGELGTRAVAARPAGVSRILVGVSILRLLFGLVAALVLVAVSAVLPMQPATRLVVALAAVTVLTAALDASWAYRGLERGLPVAAGQVVAQLVFVASILVWVRGPADVARVPLTQALGEVSAILLLALPLISRGVWVGSLREGARALRGGFTATWNRLLRTVIVTADIVLLGLLASEQAVGLYSAAYRICFLVTAIAVAAHAAYLPAMVRSVADPLAGSLTMTAATRLGWWAVAPFVAGGITLAPDLLALLFGQDFSGGSTALRLLLLGVAVLTIHGALRTAYIAADRLALEGRVLAAAAVMNILLNIWAIPRWGIAGAALTTLMSELLLLVGVLAFVHRIGLRPSAKPLLNPTLAAVAMGLALWAVPTPTGAALIGLVAAGGIGYVLLWLVLEGGPGKVQTLLAGLPRRNPENHSR